MQQLLHALADLVGDVPRLKRGDVLPHASLRQETAPREDGGGGNFVRSFNGPRVERTHKGL